MKFLCGFTTAFDVLIFNNFSKSNFLGNRKKIDQSGMGYVFEQDTTIILFWYIPQY